MRTTVNTVGYKKTNFNFETPKLRKLEDCICMKNVSTTVFADTTTVKLVSLLGSLSLIFKGAVHGEHVKFLTYVTRLNNTLFSSSFWNDSFQLILCYHFYQYFIIEIKRYYKPLWNEKPLNHNNARLSIQIFRGTNVTNNTERKHGIY